MKVIILSLTLILSSASMASTCFRARTSADPESKLPEVICVDGYSFKTVIPGLPKIPFFQATVETSFGKKSQNIELQDNQKPPFKVSVNLPAYETYSGVCSYSYKSSVIVSFLVDLDGKSLSDSLAVMGLIEENNDPCHLRNQETKIPYYQI